MNPIVLLKKYIHVQELYFRNFGLRRCQSQAALSVVVASGHKVGSTWLFNVLTETGLFRPDILPKDYRQQPHSYRFINLSAQGCLDFLRANKGFHLYKTHSLPPIGDAEEVSYVAVFRDLRDVAVSNAFYLSNLSADKGGWKELQAKNMTERIEAYLEKANYDLDLTEAWWSCPDAVKIRYEEMKEDSLGTMKKAIEELGLDLPDSVLQNALDRSSFARKAKGRQEGQEKNNSFYRKGVTGDWENYFDDRLIQVFRTAQNGRWAKLQEELGYPGFN